MTVETLRSEWVGEASNAYATAQQNWRQRIDTANAALADTTAQVDAAEVAFAAAETTNTSRW